MASSSSKKIDKELSLSPLLKTDTEVLLGGSPSQQPRLKPKHQQPHHYLHLLKPLLKPLTPPTRNQNIAALEDLRGIACLIVVNQHFTYNFTEQIFASWGTEPQAHYITQIPIVSALWAGHAMVEVFFVISGYVLSHKPLKLAREKA